MAASKRLSFSSSKDISLRSPSPLEHRGRIPLESEDWVATWRLVLARDLIDSPVVAIDADASVEEACDLLLSQDLSCIALKAVAQSQPPETHFMGLFDFADVNAFLTLAATRHTFPSEYLRDNPKTAAIVDAAKAGRVPVHLVSNLSEKNSMETLPYDASMLALLRVFSRGTHRVMIESSPDLAQPSTCYLGFVSDQRLLFWFASQAQDPANSSYAAFLSSPLSTLNLPSMNLIGGVVTATANQTVLSAMKLMSEQGVSSVAVVEEETGTLLSAVSVTDIGKTVVPEQTNQILSMPLQQLITRIRAHYGSTDGNERYPVYSVAHNNSLIYAVEKLLATNSHRLFVTNDPGSMSPPVSKSPQAFGSNISGVVSIVDILSFFARLANIPDVDPTRMQRHRRASSASASASSSSSSSSSFPGSRRSSVTDMSNVNLTRSRSGSGLRAGGGFVWSTESGKG